MNYYPPTQKKIKERMFFQIIVSNNNDSKNYDKVPASRLLKRLREKNEQFKSKIEIQMRYWMSNCGKSMAPLLQSFVFLENFLSVTRAQQIYA